MTMGMVVVFTDDHDNGVFQVFCVFQDTLTVEKLTELPSFHIL